MVYAGDSSGESYLRSAGVTLASCEVGAPSAGQLLVAGPGAGPRLAANAVGITAWLKAGGHVLAIGLNEANAFLPRMLATTVNEYIAAYFELFGAGSPFTGVSPAEVHSRSPRELSLDSGGATVVGNGVLARADDANIVFSQLVP